MERLMKLPRELQAVLGGSVLYLIFSFFDWQQVSVGPFSAGVTEWHGVGVIAGLLVIALLLWEAARLFEVKIELASLMPGLISVALALLLLVFTVITFLSHSAFRHWPEWGGLILSIVIAVAAVRRAKTEGVEMPKMPATGAIGAGSAGAAASSGAISSPPTPASDAPPDDSSAEAGT